MSLDRLFSNEIDRRDFLRKSTDVGLGLAGLLYGVDRFANFLENSLEGKLSLSPQEAEAMGCAPGLLYFKEEPPVIYPRLNGHKVQPTENGCLIGVRKVAFESISRVIDSYEQQWGKKPAVFAHMERVSIWGYFPMDRCVESAKKGVIPLVYPTIEPIALKEIYENRLDHVLKKFADGATKFGEKYGGFFFTPMYEMNIPTKYKVWPWAGQPKDFKKAWRHIWQIFEETGANEYATWVPEYHLDHSLWGYWPGDKYVDWVGLSAYNRKILRHIYGYRHLENIISMSYNYFRHKYKDKPIMLVEFGTTVGKDQPRWLRKAFETIKSKPGLKATIYWDNVCTHHIIDDHTLSQESMNTLKEIMKDPYFTGAK